jgi:hypothetical protein
MQLQRSDTAIAVAAMGAMVLLLSATARTDGGRRAVPNFEVFTKKMAPLGKKPSVTIQRKGILSFNQAAYAAIGSPEAVELLYDREERIVGVRPADPNAPHVYIPRSAVRKDYGPYLISGTAFVHYYGIDVTTSRRYPVTVEDGILCIDLKEGGTVIVGNRSSQNGHAKRGSGAADSG